MYLRHEIAKYTDALCKPSELFCEEFESAKGKEYFRAPGKHVCEYKQDVLINKGDAGTVPAGTYSGWFQQGTKLPCYPNVLASGSNFQLVRNGDLTQYKGWVGLCAPENSECSEIRDPNDTSDPIHPSGRPYYLIDNENLDSKSCTGVDVGRGCILMRNMNDSSLKYSIPASYEKYKQNNFKEVPSVSCSSTDAIKAEPTCKDSTGALQQNNANLLLKVNVDRDCAQWLGCKSSETVYNPSTNKYTDICTNLALCDKSSGAKGDVFCAHYVERADTKKEPVMSEGAYFDIKSYTNRPVGLGEKDYSGYALPTAFQIVDMANIRVAAVGAINIPDAKQKYALEYRGAAVAKIYADPNHKATANEAIELPKESQNYALNICQHVGTKVFGFFDPAEMATAKAKGGPNATYSCYLPVHAGLPGTVTLANYFPSLVSRFAADNVDVKTDGLLADAFPGSECRAQPESDSPFPAWFVKEWNDLKDPPKALTKIPGYTNATTCEKGEDCVCAYKRVEYSGAAIKKFYGMNSSQPPTGICFGGPRDGQSCLPESIYKAPSTDPNNSAVAATEQANVSKLCGPPEQGGQCQAVTKNEIVRGVFGTCLERDLSRIVGNDSSQHPCITWSPTPILNGEKDTNHYDPKSGYLPPENSGQYYCLSRPGNLSTLRLQASNPEGSSDKVKAESNFDAFGGTYTGKLTALSYDDEYTSDGNYTGTGGDPGVDLFIAGGTAETTMPSFTGPRCENADDTQTPEKDPTGIRLVQTGQKNDTSYTEAFYKLKLADCEAGAGKGLESGMCRWSELGAKKVDGAASPMTYINISPITGDNSRIICGYQEAWVDGLKGIDSGEEDQLKSQDEQWREKFFAQYNSALTKGSEDVLVAGDGTTPLKKSCVGSPGQNCYFKFWETSYRADGKTKFTALDGDNKSLEGLRGEPIGKKCEEEKPYFAIRAVFQNWATTNPSNTKQEALNLPNWFLVGFWVTTCGGVGVQSEDSYDYRYIYMHIDINRGAACDTLAEVRSKTSNQDAAYTDRVWKNGGYTVPVLGIQYQARYTPFSSALNVKPAGKDLLFQNGGAMAGFSKLNTPSFLGSGIASYYKARNYADSCLTCPTSENPWSYLSNMFARVYRIYDYAYQGVYPDSLICSSGPYLGKSCKTSADCGVYRQVCKGSGANFNCSYELDTAQYGCDKARNITKCFVGSAKQNDEVDPDKDNNNCTHGRGYYPRPNICTDPNDEYCGLRAFNITDKTAGTAGSLDLKHFPAPTDVTMGHYTPLYLGFDKLTEGSGILPIDQQVSAYGFIDYYTPRPPRIAAPSVKDCPAQGQCRIERMDSMSVDGATEGVVDVPGGQHKGVLRFYAWAEHNQMPLRKMVIDWGDGSKQEFPDAKIKNHKPFCGVAKECSDPIRGRGLTCNTDADCPAGAGKCLGTGSCVRSPNTMCANENDCPTIAPTAEALKAYNDCVKLGSSGCTKPQPTKDTCLTRQMFGNSADACQANYFEFQHLYVCGAKEESLQNCTNEGRCSRNPDQTCNDSAGCAAGDECLVNGALAQKGGCFDPNTASCRFTPRILIEDNWGWCTGECRDSVIAGQLTDSTNSSVLHKYGGCYSASTPGSTKPNVLLNTSNFGLQSFNYCNGEKFPTPWPAGSRPPNTEEKKGIAARPWIVYPGSIQLRRNTELAQ